MSIDPSFLHHRQKQGPRDGRPGTRIDTRFAGEFPSPSCLPPRAPNTNRPLATVSGRVFGSRIGAYERLIHKTVCTFCSFRSALGPAGTLETVRKGRSPRRSRIKRRTWQEGRPRVFQDRAQRWPRVISRRRRRRSTTRRFNTPWIATRNVSTFTFYCPVFAQGCPLSLRFMTLKRERRAAPHLASALPCASCPQLANRFASLPRDFLARLRRSEIRTRLVVVVVGCSAPRFTGRSFYLGKSAFGYPISAAVTVEDCCAYHRSPS